MSALRRTSSSSRRSRSAVSPLRTPIAIAYSKGIASPAGGVHRRDLQRHGRRAREPAGLRAPDQGDVDAAGGHRVDHALAGRAVAVDQEAGHVVDRAGLGQRIAGRAGGEVVADQLDAEAARAQLLRREAGEGRAPRRVTAT
jgi:hypothetical protein